MKDFEKYASLTERIQRLQVVIMGNLFAYLRASKANHGLPLTGECFHLAHNWQFATSDPDALAVYRYVLYVQRAKYWKPREIIDRWWKNTKPRRVA